MKPDVPGLTWGAFDRVELGRDALVSEGWVVSLDGRAVEDFRIRLDGDELHEVELTLGLPSPDVQRACWALRDAGRARFRASVPIGAERLQQAGGRLLEAVPVVGGAECDAILTGIQPSLAKPSADLLAEIGGGFEQIAFEFLGHLVSKLGLERSDDVLDVGCGLGRMAYGLACYLDAGARYEGFDITSHLVRWASENITPRHPNFRFQTVDLHNDWYNPRGRILPESFRYPYEDESFDAVVLTSVFTHLRPSETRHYLDEIHRVLRPGGRCLATFFLVNESVSRAIAKGESSQGFVPMGDGFLTTNPSHPEDAIAVEEDRLERWLALSGFALEATYYGLWAGRSGPRTYQDMLVFQKSGEARSVARPPASAQRVAAPTADGGSVILDEPLHRLLESTTGEPSRRAVRDWCDETGVEIAVGLEARTVLEHARLLTRHQDSDEAGRNGLQRVEGPVSVSIIVLNRDGRAHLEKLMPSIGGQTYANIETLVVDNGSCDDSVGWLRREWPNVKVVALEADAGFSGANNHGVTHASGDAYFFLNNDTKLDPRCVELLVERLQQSERAAAVVPMMRFMNNPAFVNNLGNQVGRRGWARDSYIGHLDVGQFLTIGEVPSASFGAVLVPRDVYERVGPMDDAYDYYYEDVDWSWRARQTGLKLLAEPRALVYHAGSATAGTRPWSHKLRLVARNRLRFVAKNFRGIGAIRFLGAYLVEDLGAIFRALGKGEWAIVAAYLRGWSEFIFMTPDIVRSRGRSRSPHFVRDEAILAEMDDVPHARNQSEGPVLLLPYVVEDYGPRMREEGRVDLS